MTTVSRVYDTYAEARDAVTAVEASGIPTNDVSLVANKYVSEKYADVHEVSAPGTGAGIGGVVGGGAGLLAGLGLLAIPGLGPVVAAGWLAATAVGAVAGAATGGIVGALVGAGDSEKDAHVYSESVRRGGTLVSVRTKDADAARVQAILDATSRSIRGARRPVSQGRMDDLRSRRAGLSAQRHGDRAHTSSGLSFTS